MTSSHLQNNIRKPHINDFKYFLPHVYFTIDITSTVYLQDMKQNTQLSIS